MHYRRPPSPQSRDKPNSFVRVTNSSFSSIAVGRRECSRGCLPVPGSASGGALFVAGPLVSIEIVQSSFKDIKVTAGSSGSDGAVVSGGAVSLYNPVLNTVQNSLSSLLVSGSQVSNVVAEGGDTEDGNLFFFGSAGACYGGAVFANGLYQVEIRDSVFTDNYCRGGDGGASGGDASGSAISINIPAGFLRWDLPIVLFFKDSHFVNNTAIGGLADRAMVDRGGSRASGGALHILSIASISPHITLNGCSFSSNMALGGSYGEAFGGAASVVLGGSQLTGPDRRTSIINSTFVGNIAASGSAKAGAVSWAAQAESPVVDLFVSDSQFYSNSAIGGQEVGNTFGRSYSAKPQNEAEGGALAVSANFGELGHQGVTIERSLFVNNSASCSKWVRISTLSRSYGEGVAAGGAVRVVAKTILALHDTHFENNSVSCATGTVPCTGGAASAFSIFAKNSSFVNNAVVAALPPPPPGAVPEELKIRPNSVASVVQGGAAFATEILRSEQVSFVRNSVTGTLASGGAIFASSISWMTDTQFIDCFAKSTTGSSSGGAACLGNEIGEDDELVIADTTFLHNSATTSDFAAASFGGAIATPLSDTTGFADCLFLNNTADFGGALSVTALYGLRRLDPSSFVNNTAEIGGGAIYLDLNHNVDHRSLPPDPPTGVGDSRNMTFSLALINSLCNGTFGNRAAFFGKFCAMPIDEMVLEQLPPEYVWPGMRFGASFAFVDLRGGIVVSESTVVVLSATLAGSVHADVLGEQLHGVDNPSVIVTQSPSLLPDARGKYRFSDMRLRLVPGVSVALAFAAVSATGNSQGLFPSYSPTANHTFNGNFLADVLVSPCPPGFRLEKLSDGAHECARCRPFTYSLSAAGGCVPCGHSVLSSEAEELESSDSCLLTPTFQDEDDKMWFIPRGFQPVRFHRSQLFSPC